MRGTYPILEFDPATEAVIEPGKTLDPIDIAPHAVLCFFQDVIDALYAAGRARQVHALRSEMGPHPIYEVEVGGRRLAVLQPGVGAPLAAAVLEETIALGCRRFIVCGGAGVLHREIAVGHLIVPATALRDEGTSYHYLPPGREVQAHPAAQSAIEQVLRKHHVPYLVGKTWTTDAFYRETPAKVQQRQEEGCLTVEMEAASLFAVAQFRGVPLAQVLYGGDDVSGDAWDDRAWETHASVRERLFWLAAEACLLL